MDKLFHGSNVIVEHPDIRIFPKTDQHEEYIFS